MCVCLSLGTLMHCARHEQVVPVPALLISDLRLDQTQFIITPSPTFTISGTLNFSGAKGGVKTLRVTSDLGFDESVNVSGVTQESGQLMGQFTLQMISESGTYSFTLWIIDANGRSSNKLNSSFEMIEDPNKRPTPVQLITATWDNIQNTTTLTWTKNNDTDFSAYIITRHYPFISRYGHEESSEVARVFDPNVTSITDKGNHAIGFKFEYSVSVSNGNFTAASNRLDVAYPGATITSITGEPIEVPVFSSSGDKMYFVSNESYFGKTPSVKSVSTQSHSVINSFDFGYFSPYVPLALSKDDSKLFAVTENKIIGLDASSLAVALNTTLGFFGSRVACGRADRVYVVAYAPASAIGTVKILDAGTGAEIGEIRISDVQLQSMVISPDGNTLYGVGQPMDRGNPVGMQVVYKVDISTDEPVVSSVRTASNQVKLQLSPNGEKLFVEQHYYPSTNTLLDVWSAATLQNIGQFNVSNMNGYLTSDHDVFGYSFKMDENCPSGFYYKIELVNMASGSLPKLWSYFSGWSNDSHATLLYSRDFKSLYLFDQHRAVWVVDMDHY